MTEEKPISTTEFESKWNRDHLIVLRREGFPRQGLSLQNRDTLPTDTSKYGSPGHPVWMTYHDDLSMTLNRRGNHLNVSSREERSRSLTSGRRGESEIDGVPIKREVHEHYERHPIPSLFRGGSLGFYHPLDQGETRMKRSHLCHSTSL